MGLCVAEYFSRPFLSVCPCLPVLNSPFGLIHSLIHFLALCINQSVHFVSTNFIPDPAINPEREFTSTDRRATETPICMCRSPSPFSAEQQRDLGTWEPETCLLLPRRSLLCPLSTSYAHPNTGRHTHLLWLKHIDMNRQRQMGSKGEKKDKQWTRERERKWEAESKKEGEKNGGWHLERGGGSDVYWIFWNNWCSGQAAAQFVFSCPHINRNHRVKMYR